MLRKQNERDIATQEHAINEMERQRERRGDEERQELEEAIRQSRHENTFRKARLKRPRQQQEDIFLNSEILREIAELRELVTKGKDGGRRQLEEAARTPFARRIQLVTIFRMKDRITMSELCEYQEEYIALEEKERDMYSYPVPVASEKIGNASLLPRMTNAVASSSQGSKEKLIITPPPNLGQEPPSEKISKEFCAYHRFHGHTTNNCKNMQRIILRMIRQAKVNHFLATPLPPPPPPPPPRQPTTGGQTSGADKGKKYFSDRSGSECQESTLYKGRQELLNSSQVYGVPTPPPPPPPPPPHGSDTCYPSPTPPLITKQDNPNNV
ncbi:actin cytoskeleton-regulatory complex protein pan1-like [Papaver somniferum]|uniref:actin cytoskeleton-regulatory complex protein pan1-like n=1 Tax=Papaver somniferum TaxID=3469 RepID=UPI000E6F9A25|nr:actin cytoskeleton-regulatory complex protein pan1-like [Papaver somniferum]